MKLKSKARYIIKGFMFFGLIMAVVISAKNFYPVFADKKTVSQDASKTLKDKQSGKSNQESAGKNVVTVVLKNKGRITGTLQDSVEGEVVVDTGVGTIGVNRDDVAEIIHLSKQETENFEVKFLKTKLAEQKEETAQIEDISQRNEEYLELRQKQVQAEEDAQTYRVKSIRDDMIVVEAVLNGRVKTDMLVDTGAAYVSISPSIAKKAGYRVTNQSERINLLLADGSLHQAVLITLKSINIGKKTAKNIKAVISDSGNMEYGILGISFLNKFNVKIDAKKNEIVFMNK
ncbi:MAG: retropepsin-like aspartic protease [Candidatus Omnitrophota bacterium]